MTFGAQWAAKLSVAVPLELHVEQNDTEGPQGWICRHWRGFHTLTWRASVDWRWLLCVCCAVAGHHTKECVMFSLL